jgi:hypothetical protein
MGRMNGFSAEQVEQLEMVRLTLVYETQRRF